MKKVKPVDMVETSQVWDKAGKNPDNYTWDEYQKLSFEDQDAFFNWFKSTEDFEVWMENARN